MSHQSDDIKAYLRAFSPEVVEAALVEYRAGEGGESSSEWKTWTGGGRPPSPPYEWREINGQTQYKEAASQPDATLITRAPKTDTALRRNPGMSCPYCGAETYLEPLCPACQFGRAGLSARIICGEHSDHIFYIPRGGDNG